MLSGDDNMIPIKYENLVNVLYSVSISMFSIMQLNNLMNSVLLYPLFVIIFVVIAVYVYQLTQDSM